MTGPNVVRAVHCLDDAIALHQRHMDGTEPTTGPAGDRSQRRLMDHIMAARAALGGSEMEQVMRGIMGRR
jgi:hypothetical protein